MSVIDPPEQLVVSDGLDGLDGAAEEWDALAVAHPSPFLTLPWLRAYCDAFRERSPLALTLRSGEGVLRGAALLARSGRAGLRAPANDHSGDWDVLAADPGARRALWHAIAALPARRITLPAMLADGASDQPAREALSDAGYRLVQEDGARSPYLELPGSLEGLMAGTSRNLRSQVGRRRRSLDRQGRLVFRTATGGPRLEHDLDRFLTLEGSGWKRRRGTAIVCDPQIEALYRVYAREAAARGWLRLHMLELDGHLLAADYACVLGTGEFLIKTAFDEDKARWSPGLVLRWEVLRQAIEAGLGSYDFLGGPDAYKLRWTDQVRPRVTVHGFRGPGSEPALAYRRWVRPALKQARRRLRDRRDAANGSAGPAEAGPRTEAASPPRSSPSA